MNSLNAWLLRARLRLEYWARRNKASACLALLNLAVTFLRRGDLTSAITRFLVAAHPSPFGRILVPAALRATSSAAHSRASVAATIDLTRCIVVKAPVSDAERGILLVSFESELDSLLSHGKFPAFEQEYQIAFLPSWQPAYSPSLLHLAAVATRPWFIMPAAPSDLGLRHELGSNCVPLPFQASSWVSQHEFATSESKDVDISMLAIFGRYKLHWRLFEGLAQMKSQPRVVLAGKPWEGRTAETLMAEAAAFGVTQHIEYITNPSQAAISDLLARSRLLFAPSYKEGSFIAVVEAMMSNTPVALYQDAIVGSKIYVNERTGFLLDSNEALGPQLERALAGASATQPREWAAKNISAEANVPKLNQMMRDHSISSGCKWTRDISAFHSRNLYFLYAEANQLAALLPEYQRLGELYGFRFQRYGTQSVAAS